MTFQEIEHVTAGLVEQGKIDREENRQLWRDTQRQIRELTGKVSELTGSVSRLTISVSELTGTVSQLTITVTCLAAQVDRWVLHTAE